MAPRVIDRGRGPEIEGTRVTVYRIMDFTREGSATDRIGAELDLAPDQVRAALEYIEAHRSEVEAEYEKILDRVHGPNAAWVEDACAKRGRVETADSGSSLGQAHACWPWRIMT